MKEFKVGQTIVFNGAYDLKQGRFFKDEIGYVTRNDDKEVIIRIPRDVFLVIPKNKVNGYLKIFQTEKERNSAQEKK